MNEWNNQPTTADYAYSAANDAKDEIKKLKAQVSELQDGMEILLPNWRDAVARERKRIKK